MRLKSTFGFMTVALVLCGLLWSPALAAGAEAEGKVNINTADHEELITLPGIGPALAGRILEYREEHGSFRRIEDLRNVRGIGEKSFLNMRDHVTVGKGGSKGG